MLNSIELHSAQGCEQNLQKMLIQVFKYCIVVLLYTLMYLNTSPVNIGAGYCYYLKAISQSFSCRTLLLLVQQRRI